jgi:GTPase involved in cell partitioning and DNA repair
MRGLAQKRCDGLFFQRDTLETAGRDPVNDLKINPQEFASFSSGMAAKLMLMMVTKMDVTPDCERVAALDWLTNVRGSKSFLLSNVIELGVDALKYRIGEIGITS